jgi:hypothetical protein
VHGEQVVATTVSADDWAAYHGRTPWPVLSCGADAYAKTSHLGTQFFQHAVRCDADHKGESADHLRTKAAIIAAATALGWNARAEVPADNRSWIADVLAERDGRRVAFEVQLSGQVEGGYQHRQARYAAEGIECYWLTKRARPAELRDVPALNIRLTDTDITVAATARSNDRVPLEDFITATLTGELRWAPPARSPQDAKVRWALHRCATCDQHSAIWDADINSTIHCSRCLHTRTGTAVPGSGEPRRLKAARGVTIPSALHRRNRNGDHQFRCPDCPTPIPPIGAAALWDAVTDTSSTGTADLHAHWCAPEAVMAATGDVIDYLRGTRQHLQPDQADTRGEAELIASANRRHALAAAAELTRRDQLAAQARAAQWQADRLAEAVIAAEADPGRRGAAAAEFIRDVQLQAERNAREAHLRASGKTGPDGPIPPWTGPPPQTAHERTAAIDEYATKHLRDVDDLLLVFPAIAPECVCHDCRTVHETFDKPLRKILWAGRSNGRIDSAAHYVPRTTTA